MTETDLIKPISGPKPQHGKELGDKNETPMCEDATRQIAVSNTREFNEESSVQSRMEGEKPSPSPASTADHAAPLSPISTWLFSCQLSGLCHRAFVSLLVFAFWCSLSYSVSIQAASSSNRFNNANDLPTSISHCNRSLCYNVSLSFRKPEGILPSFSSLRTIWVPPVLKTCMKDGSTFSWSKQANGRKYMVTCSDTFIQESTDIIGDGGSAAGVCLANCIANNRDCKGVLYLVDRPFEKNCFFQHRDERPAFEAGERVLGAKLMKD